MYGIDVATFGGPVKPGVTQIASYLAGVIPTGSNSEEERVQDWRTTLYNAKATRSQRVVSSMIRRLLPGDRKAEDLCEVLEEND